MKKAFLGISLLSILSYSCWHTPKKILQTGINETLVHNSDVPITRTEIDKRKHEDLEPYSGLTIQGPLSKDEIARAVRRNRDNLASCYRRNIGQAPALLGSHDYNENQNDRRKSIKPDGMIDSTNYGRLRRETPSSLAGEAFVNFTVGTDGKARDARSTLADFSWPMRRCLEEVVNGFQFSPQANDSHVRYLVLRFSTETRILDETSASQ